MLASKMKSLMTRFGKEESGLALTEYLLLLALLTGAVIGAVLLFGAELGANWTVYANWMRDLVVTPPPTQ